LEKGRDRTDECVVAFMFGQNMRGNAARWMATVLKSVWTDFARLKTVVIKEFTVEEPDENQQAKHGQINPLRDERDSRIDPRDP
jgi:hypothetical protein